MLMREAISRDRGGEVKNQNRGLSEARGGITENILGLNWKL
jgi:hypothetical protein